MKTKLTILAFALMVISGIFFTLKFGLRPRPVSLIRLSSFESAEKLAQSVHLRMRQELQRSPILLIGYQAEKPHQLEVVRALLQSLNSSELRYDTLVAEDKLPLPPDLKVDETIQAGQQVEAFARGLQAGVAAKRRIVAILPAIYSAQLIGGNVADLLVRKYQVPVLSFSLVEFPRFRDQEKQVTLPCQMQDADTSGVGNLGCAILQTGRMHYRKKMAPGQRTAIMEQRGSSDYLIYYSNEPEVKSRDSEAVSEP